MFYEFHDVIRLTGRDAPWSSRWLSADCDGCTSVHPYVSLSCNIYSRNALIIKGRTVCASLRVYAMKAIRVPIFGGPQIELLSVEAVTQQIGKIYQVCQNPYYLENGMEFHFESYPYGDGQVQHQYRHPKPQRCREWPVQPEKYGKERDENY